MEITLFGIIVIIMSIYAFFRNEKLLLNVLVFISTFTAAELFHITKIGAPILPFEFVGSLWLLKVFIEYIKTKPNISVKSIVSKFKENKIATAFLLFIVAVLLGQLMSVLLGESLSYTDFKGNMTIIKFGMSNIKQTIIVSFVFLLMIVLSFRIKTKKEIEQLLKVFGISTIFAIIWGFIQFGMYYLKIDYPAFLFNNNIFAAQLYNQADNGIKRICSIALEPSMFSVNLITFIPFTIGSFIALKESIKNKKYIVIFLITVMTTVCTILTTSSTAIIGLVTAFGIYGLYMLFVYIKNGEMSNVKSNIGKLFLVAIVSIIIAGAICIIGVKIENRIENIDPSRTYIDENDTNTLDAQELKEKDEEIEVSGIEKFAKTMTQMTIGKLQSTSGRERLYRETNAMNLFKHSPLFGIGFGAYRTFSLLTNVLLGTGMFGLVCLFYILFVALRELIKNRKNAEHISVMFIVSILSGIICLFAGVPDFIFIYYWMIIVLGYKYATLKD